MTDFLRPRSLEEALDLRGRHPGYELLAGGTDFMVDLPQRKAPAGVIDLFGLDELTEIDVDGDAFRIGAAVTYRMLLESRTIATHVPMLACASREVGAMQIQERGTLGGNIATSSPVGDTLPVLLALDASIEVGSREGRRTIPYTSFCTGYRTTALARDEIILAVTIPLPKPGTRQWWRKVGTRQAQSISKVMMAAAARLDEDGNIRDPRIAFGAVAERPVRLDSVEKALAGHPADEETATRAAEEARKVLTPIDDVRSTARYRTEISANLIRRFVLGLPATSRSAGSREWPLGGFVA